MFFDEVNNTPAGDCANKTVGGQGSYTTWAAGQKDFLTRVLAGIKAQSPNTHFFANIFNPQFLQCLVNDRTLFCL